MKALRDMVTVMQTDLSYNEAGKAKFKSLSTKVLKQLGKDLELKELKVDFNPGGIAVSGDANLMGMWGEENGIYVKINQSMGRLSFLYRTIKHMKDYTGGFNQYITYETSDYASVLERLGKLRKGGM